MKGGSTFALFVLVSFTQAGCLGAPRPTLVPDSGDLASLHGATEFAVYGTDEDLALLKTALVQVNSAIVFTTADNAQVIIQFQVYRQPPACVDCGPDWKPGPVHSIFAFASIERHNDHDHCLPPLLRANWQHEAYTQRGLIRALVKSLAPYLTNAGA